MATVLITGANRGIGLAFVQHYLSLGDTVIAACRFASNDLRNSQATVIEEIDVSCDASMEKLKKAVGEQSIDILINNAGIFCNETIVDMPFADIEKQFQVNAMGPLRVTHALQDHLSAGSKIALITSRMGSIEDNGSGAYYGYRMSKAALNAAGKSLAHDFKVRGVAVAILHPGMVSTEMIGFCGDVSPEQAVSGLTTRIDELNLSNTGTFWHANGEILPW
ncbi:MAG: SDR family oxidoreductase [Pseudomonadales bacterium]|nr:SDR family oxidoreductase [Pseudomonadales bacterium]